MERDADVGAVAVEAVASLRTRGAQAVGRAAIGSSLVIAGLSASVVMLRAAPLLSRPQFIWEEARGYWLPTFTSGILSIFESWPAGYLTITTRAAFLLGRLVPPELAPVLILAVHAVVIGLVTAFLASDRLALAIPDRRVRVAFALSIPFLPVAEPFLSATSMQWFLALFLVGMSLATDRRWWDLPAMMLAGLSGIGALVALPLFWRDRRGAILLACAVPQAALLLASDRPSSLGDPTLFLVRAGVVGVIVLALAVALSRTLPAKTMLSFVYVAAATAIGGLFVAGDYLADPSLNGRFFLATAAAATLVGLAGLAQRRPAAFPLVAGLLATAAYSFPLPTSPDTDWPEHARCIGGPVACTVPSHPADWSVEWRPTSEREPRGSG